MNNESVKHHTSDKCNSDKSIENTALANEELMNIVG